LTIPSPDSIYGDAFLIRALERFADFRATDKSAVFARPESGRKIDRLKSH
jgi:hypothetical protein